MRGYAKCNYSGVLAGMLGGKWTYYPQIPCDCQRHAADDKEFADVVLGYLDARRERYNDRSWRIDWPYDLIALEDGSTFCLSPSPTWERRQPAAIAARIRAEEKRARKAAKRSKSTAEAS